MGAVITIDGKERQVSQAIIRRLEMYEQDAAFGPPFYQLQPERLECTEPLSSSPKAKRFGDSLIKDDHPGSTEAPSAMGCLLARSLKGTMTGQVPERSFASQIDKTSFVKCYARSVGELRIARIGLEHKR